MDPIEPVRLDMGLLNAALAQRSHMATLQEEQRHHGIMETHAEDVSSAARQKVQADELEMVMKNPEIDPLARQRAAAQLYKFATKGQGEQLDPGDYLQNAPLWNTFLSKNKENPNSQDTADAMQELLHISPFAKDEALAAQKRQQNVAGAQGMSQLATRMGQAPLSPQESTAVGASGPLQGKLGEAAFISPLEQAKVQNLNERTAELKTQEAIATHAYQAMNQAVTPVFNMDAEEAFKQELAKKTPQGALGKALSGKESHDRLALTTGTLTVDERNQAKENLPQEMQQLNQNARALQQELHNAKNDVTGSSRPPEQIQAELAAIRTAVTIKGKELAYATDGTTANRLALKQSYEAFQKKLDESKATILRLRNDRSTVAQSALDFKTTQELSLANAQREYLKTGDLQGTLAKYPNVRADQVREAEKNPNKPLVEVDLAEKASVVAAKQFMESTRTTYDQLKNAPAQLKNLAEAKALIPKAKGFMGPGGESLLGAAKFLNNRLGMSINTEGVKSAEELRTRIFANIMDNLKKMDAQPSQMQQVFMMEALGNLGTDPNALTNVLNAYEDTIRNKVEVHNAEVEGAKNYGDVKFPYDPRIKLPPSNRGEKIGSDLLTPTERTAPLYDPEKERRYQEYKRKQLQK